MSEINLRIANFFKVFSMLIVVVSLAYMYAYVTDKVDFLRSDSVWHDRISKEFIFYSGLGIFAVYNLIMGLAINMYEDTRGVDKSSLLFKSELQKQKLIVWFTYLLTGGNLFIASMIFYLALVKINLAGNTTDYIYFPLTGALILMSILLTLIYQLIKK